jgi:hypothetical protein
MQLLHLELQLHVLLVVIPQGSASVFRSCMFFFSSTQSQTVVILSAAKNPGISHLHFGLSVGL